MASSFRRRSGHRALACRTAHLTRLVRAATLAVAASTAALGGSVASAQAAPAAATCAADWGSLAKTSGSFTQREVTGVRAGQHACYDRLVVDLDAVSPHRVGYDVRYVSAVHEDGTGDVVALRGGAAIQVTLHAPAYAGSGDPTYTPADPNELVGVARYRTFRQIAFAGSSEGYTTIGLGVRARLPVRVSVVAGPDHDERLVVDVAHQW